MPLDQNNLGKLECKLNKLKLARLLRNDLIKRSFVELLVTWFDCQKTGDYRDFFLLSSEMEDLFFGQKCDLTKIFPDMAAIFEAAAINGSSVRGSPP